MDFNDPNIEKQPLDIYLYGDRYASHYINAGKTTKINTLTARDILCEKTKFSTFIPHPQGLTVSYG